MKRACTRARLPRHSQQFGRDPGSLADILEAAHRVQDGSGVVLLTDMFGGTPSNLAISAMDGGRIEVICGINLPMLIKLATLRDTAELDHAVVEARDQLRRGRDW